MINETCYNCGGVKNRWNWRYQWWMFVRESWCWKFLTVYKISILSLFYSTSELENVGECCCLKVKNVEWGNWNAHNHKDETRLRQNTKEKFSHISRVMWSTFAKTHEEDIFRFFRWDIINSNNNKNNSNNNSLEL